MKNKIKENQICFLMMGILSACLVMMFSGGISGNDFWWHVKAGEWIAAYQEVPKLGIFSWYAMEEGLPWISHEWLSELFYYLIYSRTGSVGIFGFCAGAAFLMCGLILIRNRKNINRSPWYSFLYLIPAVLMISFFFYGRPHIFSFFLLYGVLACLYRIKERESSKAFLAVPVLAVLWANFHGGSSNLPYLLCFLFLLSGCANVTVGRLAMKRWSGRQAAAYGSAGVLSTAAVLLNPFGVRMLLYPYANMKDKLMLSVISEWAPPDAKDPMELLLMFGPVVMAALAYLLADRKVEVTDFILFLFFSLMFFRSARFIALFIIAASFCAMPYFPSSPMKSCESRREWAAYGIMILLIAGVWGMEVRKTIQTWDRGELISSELSADSLKEIKQELNGASDGRAARLYNDYSFGESLIFEEVPVFMDGRADLYSGHNLRDGMELALLKRMDEGGENVGVYDPQEVIDKYGFDYLLIRKQQPLAVWLESRPDQYRLIYEDDTAVFYKTAGQ